MAQLLIGFILKETIFIMMKLLCFQMIAPVVAGWNEYYIQKQGERQPINVISQYNIEPDELQTYERVYYIHLQGSWLRSELRDVLNQKFSQVDQNEYFVIYQRN